MDAHNVEPFDIIDHHGRMRRVHPASDADVIADLAAALELDRGPLTIDGSVVDGAARLVDVAELRTGAQLGPPDANALSTSEPADDGDVVVEIAVVAGSDCGRWRSLVPGRYGIGRAADAAISIADPSVEPYVGLLVVDHSGDIDFLQLGGLALIEVEPHPTDPESRLIDLGASVLHVRPPRAARGDGTVAAGEIHMARSPWQRVVRRASSPTAPGLRPVPDRPPQLGAPRRVSATGLIASAMSIVGAVVGVVVFGSLMFALFAGLAALASIATWLASAVGARRAHRRERRSVGRAEDEFVASFAAHASELTARRRAAQPTIAQTLQVIDGLCTGNERSMVWMGDFAIVDAGDRTAIRIPIGRGAVAIDAAPLDGIDDHVASRIARSTVADEMPIDIVVGCGEAVAVHAAGAQAASLVRAAVLQLATWHGPSELRLDATGEITADWSWMRWLPHYRSGADRSYVDGQPPTLVIVDDPGVLSMRTSDVRCALDNGEIAVLAIVPVGRAIPSRCRATVTVGARGQVAFDGVEHRVRRGLGCGLSLDTAASAARTLAALIDPEDVDAACNTPQLVDLDELEPELIVPAVACGAPRVEHATTALAEIIGERWAQARPIAAVLGRSGADRIDVCFDRDGPHVLIGGTTGSGKSELVRTLVASLASRHSPDDVAFVLVDYKGGAAFDACASLPHVIGMVTDLDDGVAERALAALRCELRLREERLRANGASDAGDYRRRSAPVGPMPDVVVVVDEFATLAADHPEHLEALVSVAQRGRSLGIHLVLATQRPGGAINDDVRANTDVRIALRTQTPGDSTDIIDDRCAALLPRASPGRAVVRLGHDQLVELQTARCTGPPHRRDRAIRVEDVDDPVEPDHAMAAGSADRRLLDELVAAASLAMERDERSRPSPLWLDPLPEHIDHRDLPGLLEATPSDGDVCVGVVDDPERCRRHPLQWTPELGGLVLLGAPGSGVTTTIVALLLAASHHRSPADLHLYVIDALGDTALDEVATLAHCAAVVRRSERERIARLLGRLRTEIERRAACGVDAAPTVVCAIDGYGALRRLLADDPEIAADLTSVVDEGAAVGVVVLAGDDTSAATALSAADRWIFHLGGPTADRVPGPAVPAGVPGRLRVGSSGLFAHVAQPAAAPPGPCIRREVGVPAEVQALPDTVSLRGSAGRPTCAANGLELPVGLAADTLEPAVLTVPSGDHVIVLGGARSGRSSALQTLAAQWHRATAGRVVCVVGRDPTELIDAALADGDDPVLLMIDDAERIDDPRSLLTAIANGRRDNNVTIIAAARLDAVRGAFGHWTRDVARGRCGVVMSSPGDIDGELLGCTLPRRSIIAPRPGLGWVVDPTGQRLVQFAAKLPA
ncbi:MAG: FtsK/SpoIIIE domain-containing protein [Actinomycetota bacterium]